MFSLTGGKDKKKESSSYNQAQTSTTSLSPYVRGLLDNRMTELQKGDGYSALDPKAYEAYLNPYQDEVIAATTADINANRDMAANQQRSDLAGAAAFGDKRRGIMEAELGGQYDRTLATTLAGLRSRGFSEAQGIAAGENANKNNYNQMTQQQINQLLDILARGETVTNTTGSGSSKGQSTGYNLGFKFNPFAPQTGA